MNYEKHYNLLITKRGKQQKPKQGYYERHHIVPKSMGGDDSQENLVYLTAREHYMAHWMLWKLHRNRQMATAFWRMVNGDKRRPAPSYAVESARVAHNEKHGSYISELMLNSEHRYRGKTLSVDHREKMSKTRIGQKRGSYLKAAVCPHCGKTGTTGNMNRWHFDNCKLAGINDSS